jgi:G3E family GTPase
VSTPSRIPVIVLTGFLGSGKTTLLNALLRDRRWAETLVIVNEVGEIGLDHLLIERSDDNVLLLDSGCMCCAMQGGFRETLADLYVRRANGSIPPFARVVVETTGLADPGPIVNALAADSLLREEFALAGVVTTVDCLAGGETLDRQWEAVRQAAMADSIVLTKTDLVPTDRITALEARIASINPYARRLRSVRGGSAVELLDPHDLTAGAGRAARAPSRGLFASGGKLAAAELQHDAGIRARSFVLAGAVSWADLAAWQSAIVERLGERVLRVKGIVEIADTGRPIVIHGIGRYFHPPERLAAWPSDDHRSRLVLIGRDVDDAALDAAMNLLAPAAAHASG